MIAATKKPQSKITPIANITTTNNHISSDNNDTNSPSCTMVESNDESSNDITIMPVTKVRELTVKNCDQKNKSNQCHISTSEFNIPHTVLSTIIVISEHKYTKLPKLLSNVWC